MWPPDFHWFIPNSGFSWRWLLGDDDDFCDWSECPIGKIYLVPSLYCPPEDGHESEKFYESLNVAIAIDMENVVKGMMSWRSLQNEGTYETLLLKREASAAFSRDKEEAEWREYSPFKEQTALFRNFAERTTHDAFGLLKFANQFGSFGKFGLFPDGETAWESVVAFPSEGTLSRGRTRVLNPVLHGPRDICLGSLVFEAHEMHQAVKIWQMLKNGNIPILSMHFQWKNDPETGKRCLYFDSHPELGTHGRPTFPEFRRKSIISSEERPEEWAVLRDKDVNKAANWFLAKTIYRYTSRHTDTRLEWNPIEKRMTRDQVPIDLLGAMWLQFETAITGEKEYRNCPACGSFFEVTQRVGRPATTPAGKARIEKHLVARHVNCAAKDGRTRKSPRNLLWI